MLKNRQNVKYILKITAIKRNRLKEYYAFNRKITTLLLKYLKNSEFNENFFVN